MRCSPEGEPAGKEPVRRDRPPSANRASVFRSLTQGVTDIEGGTPSWPVLGWVLRRRFIIRTGATFVCTDVWPTRVTSFVQSSQTLAGNTRAVREPLWHR